MIIKLDEGLFEVPEDVVLGDTIRNVTGGEHLIIETPMKLGEVRAKIIQATLGMAAETEFDNSAEAENEVFNMKVAAIAEVMRVAFPETPIVFIASGPSEVHVLSNVNPEDGVRLLMDGIINLRTVEGTDPNAH